MVIRHDTKRGRWPQLHFWSEERKVQTHTQTDIDTRHSRSADLTFSYHLFTESGIPAHGMLSATFRAGLPSSVTHIWKQPHRHPQRHVFQATTNLVLLTMKITHHTTTVPKLYLGFPKMTDPIFLACMESVRVGYVNSQDQRKLLFLIIK